jgi:hypothetical protein
MSQEIVDTQSGEILEAPTVDGRLVFGTSEPEQIIAKATAVSNRLVDIVEKGKLYSLIKTREGERKFVKAEGWTAMIAMLGIFPRADYCKRLEREDEIAYEAKVTLRHLSGIEVGAGDAICSSRERNWSGRDEYAIKSMAQTRAVGKACRLSFSWIMALAGYEVTPAEEMVSEDKPKITMPKAKASTPIMEEPEISFPGEEAPREYHESEVAPEYLKEPPVSKFLKPLHTAATKAGIPNERMKEIIMQTYGVDSSKKLDDRQIVALIKAIETKDVC